MDVKSKILGGLAVVAVIGTGIALPEGGGSMKPVIQLSGQYQKCVKDMGAFASHDVCLDRALRAQR